MADKFKKHRIPVVDPIEEQAVGRIRTTKHQKQQLIVDRLQSQNRPTYESLSGKNFDECFAAILTYLEFLESEIERLKNE